MCIFSIFGTSDCPFFASLFHPTFIKHPLTAKPWANCWGPEGDWSYSHLPNPGRLVEAMVNHCNRAISCDSGKQGVCGGPEQRAMSSVQGGGDGGGRSAPSRERQISLKGSLKNWEGFKTTEPTAQAKPQWNERAGKKLGCCRKWGRVVANQTGMSGMKKSLLRALLREINIPVALG